MAVAAPESARGQQFSIPRIAEAIELDGAVTERVWLNLPPLPVAMFEPEFQAPITRSSTIRIAHDGLHLYASGVFVDDAPPTANSLIRDYYAEDDVFNVVIDSFNDDETAFYFLVTPAGTRVDGAITDDVEGPNWQHEEFDNIWDARAIRTADGWSAEMRIPLSSLRVRPTDGVVRMGLIAGRLIVRLRERHTFPAIRPGPSIAQFKPSLAADVVLEGLDFRRPVELRPYGLGGWSGTSRTVAVETGPSYELGGDAKIALGPRMTLDLTANTDFAQTEADAVQVNLDRFSLFLPEKRQFFLERAGTFMFGYADEHQLFYSRRVGLSDLGARERIYGGARATGRVDRGDLGALSLQVNREEGESANLSAFRYRRPFLRGSSYIGGIATGVIESGSDASTFAGGLDTQIDLSRSRFATASFAMSRDSAGELAMHTRVSVEKRNRAGWSYRLAGTQIDAAYEPPLGFVRRRGVQQLDAAIFRGSYGRSGRIQESLISGSTHLVRRRSDEALETAIVGLTWDARRRGGGTGSFQVLGRHENVLHQFRLGNGAPVPAGEYAFVEFATSIGLPDGWSRRAYADFSGGQYFDGRRFTVALRPVWNVSRHLELGADLEMNRIAFPDRDQSFDADIVRFRFRAAANTHLSAYGLLQYDGASGQTASNVRLRLHIAEGRDAYLVWNEAHHLPMVLDVSTEPGEFNQRSLALKYTHVAWW
jgi:hypothetical protein